MTGIGKVKENFKYLWENKVEFRADVITCVSITLIAIACFTAIGMGGGLFPLASFKVSYKVIFLIGFLPLYLINIMRVSIRVFQLFKMDIQSKKHVF